MVGEEGSNPVPGRDSLKADVRSDCLLHTVCMKSETLVIAGQHAAGNPFPGLVHTARHTTKAENTRSR